MVELASTKDLSCGRLSEMTDGWDSWTEFCSRISSLAIWSEGGQWRAPIRERKASLETRTL